MNKFYNKYLTGFDLFAAAPDLPVSLHLNILIYTDSLIC